MLAELEAMLHDSFSPENLSAYADYLQGRADPRGELIALDLRHAEAPDPALAAMSRQRVANLLGPIHQRLPQSTFQFGFVQELRLNDAWHGSPGSVLHDLLASPFGPYIRTIRLSGGTTFLKYALAALANVPRFDWLERLTIRHDRFAVVPRSPIGTRAVAAALIAATPRLAAVEIIGQNVFGAFAHPNVTTWTLSHADSIKTPPPARSGGTDRS